MPWKFDFCQQSHPHKYNCARSASNVRTQVNQIHTNYSNVHVKFYMQLGKFACIFSCNFACIFSHVFFLWNLHAILLISTHETRLQCCNAHGLCCMHSFVFTKLNCSESLAYWFCENKLMRICRTSALSMKKSIFLSHEVWAHSPVGILRACESVICG